MAPPITENPATYVPPPGGPTTQPTTQGVERYEPRWLKPTMFGLMNWRDLEMGLSATQSNAIYHWLSQIDNQGAVPRYSNGSFARDMLRQARERVMRAIPNPVIDTPADPVTNPVVDEPIGRGATYDPTKDPDYRGNTYVPPVVEPPVITQPPPPDVVTDPPDTTTPKYVPPPVVAQTPEGARRLAGSGWQVFTNGQWVNEDTTAQGAAVPRPAVPTITPQVTEMPTVDWQTQLPQQWRGLATYGKSNPNWWKSYFDYDATQRRFTPNAKVGTRLGLTAFTVPNVGSGTGPYVKKPKVNKVMF